MVGAGFDVGALIAPVRTHPQLGLFVHGVGANLHLQHLALRAEHGGVQRAVAIFLGVGDVVVELLGNVPPQGVHDTQGGVAVAHLRHQHAYCAHVVDLAELQALALHLAPDRIDVFRPAADVGLDAGGFQLLAQMGHGVVDVLFTIETALVQQLGDLLVLLRLQVAEGQILQFPLDMTDPEAVSQRRVDVEHLARHALTLLFVGFLDRANGAGTLGQFDQRHAHVIDHGHQHLAQVLDLRLRADHHRFTRIDTGADRRHAQHTFDQLGHHRTEALLHGGQGDLTLAHAAIDDRGNQRILIELEIGEDFRDVETGAECRCVLTPVMRCGVGLLLQITGELAGFLQCLTIQRRIDASDMLQPGLEIDAAVIVDWLMRSHLNHRLTFPTARIGRTEQSPAFSEPVGLTERMRILHIPAVPNVPLWPKA